MVNGAGWSQPAPYIHVVGNDNNKQLKIKAYVYNSNHV